MKLIRTTVLSAIVTVFRVSSNFIAGKLVAIYTGPAGVAIVGAFINFVTVALTFSNGAINTGVVKYTSEFKDDNSSLKSLFSTSLQISLYCSLIGGSLILIFASFISNLVFHTPIFSNPVRVLGGTIFLYSLNTLILSILNGLGEIKSFTIINTIGSFVSLIFTAVLVSYYKIEGALYALALSQSIVFFITIYLVLKKNWISFNSFMQPFSKIWLHKLSGYSFMAIVSAITLPVSQIILRNYLIEDLGVDKAGYWQGMMRISDGYLMVIVTALNTYYLPKLSGLFNDIEIRKEILQGYKLILPVVFFSCLIIYIFRFFIISILFSKEFLEIGDVILWQLVGDFFKILAWVLSYLLIAKAMIKTYIFAEIFFSLSYILISLLLVKSNGLEGTAMAFAINYFLYLIFMIFVFRKLLLRKGRLC